MAIKKKRTVPYSLNIPIDVYERLQEIAFETDSSVAEILRRGIRWELLQDALIEKGEGGQILIRKTANDEPEAVTPLRSIT